MRPRRSRGRKSGAGEGSATLGQRIKAARRSRAMTQGDLAAGVCSISFVSMVEHDRVRPSLSTLRTLAERLGKPLSHFLEDESVPAPLVGVQRAEGLLRQHRFAEALEAFHAIRPSGRDPLLHTRCELGVGQALAGLRRFELAEPHLQHAADLAAASGDPELAAAVANAQGFFAFRARRFAAAQEVFEDALARLRSAGLQGTEVYGKLLANLGRVAIALGLPSQALEYFRQASETLAAAADPFHLGLLYFNVGVAWEQQRSFERAHDSLRKAAELFTVHENVRLLGMVKRSIGMLHLERGALAAARVELEASLHLAEQSGDDEGTAQTLVEIARLCCREGDAAAAQRAARDAETLAVRIHDDAEAARAQAALAEALAAAGQSAEAVSRYEEAVASFIRLQMAGEAVRVSRDLGFLLMREGAPDRAAHWFAQAFDLQQLEPAAMPRDRQAARPPGAGT